MNKVYMHYKENKPWYIKGVFVIFLSFILYGFYKNGLVYFLQNRISFMELCYPLLFPLLGVIFCLIGEIIRNKSFKVSFNSIIEGILLGIMMPPRMNIFLYLILIGVYTIINLFIPNKKYCISKVLIFKIVSIILCSVMAIDYQNIIEFQNPYLYGIVDTIFGRSVGGLGTTSIFLISIYYFLRTNDYYYKKELPTYIITSFSIIVIGYTLIFSKGNLLLSLLNSHVYFMAIVLSTITNTSPAEKRFLIPFGILVGAGSFLSSIILNYNDGIYITLFIVQIIFTVFFLIKKKLMLRS